jgi:hypothetical protein
VQLPEENVSKTLKATVLEIIKQAGEAGVFDTKILDLLGRAAAEHGEQLPARDKLVKAIQCLVADRRAVRMETDPHAAWWAGIKRFRVPAPGEMPDPSAWATKKGKPAPSKPEPDPAPELADALPDIICPTCDHVLTDADLGRLVRSGRLGLVASQEQGGDAQ